jgi:hypothetical protein
LKPKKYREVAVKVEMNKGCIKPDEQMKENIREALKVRGEKRWLNMQEERYPENEVNDSISKINTVSTLA